MKLNIYFDHTLDLHHQVKYTTVLFELWKKYPMKLLLFGHPLYVYCFRFLMQMHQLHFMNCAFILIEFIKNVVFCPGFLSTSIRCARKHKKTLQLGTERIPRSLNKQVIRVRDFMKENKAIACDNSSLQRKKKYILLRKHNAWFACVNVCDTLTVTFDEKEFRFVKGKRKYDSKDNCFVIWHSNGPIVSYVSSAACTAIPQVNEQVMKPCKVYYDKSRITNFIHYNGRYIFWNNFIFSLHS